MIFALRARCAGLMLSVAAWLLLNEYGSVYPDKFVLWHVTMAAIPCDG